MNSFDTISLDKLDDTPKTGLHIGWKRFEFIADSIVEQLYDPRYPVALVHFCNVTKDSPAEG
jgi:hypothetical protein